RSKVPRFRPATAAVSENAVSIVAAIILPPLSASGKRHPGSARRPPRRPGRGPCPPERGRPRGVPAFHAGLVAVGLVPPGRQYRTGGLGARWPGEAEVKAHRAKPRL